jgi:hypothetical protein
MSEGRIFSLFRLQQNLGTPSDEEETTTTQQGGPLTNNGELLEARIQDDANVIRQVPPELKSLHEDALHSLSVAIDNDRTFPIQMPWIHYTELLLRPSDRKETALALLELLQPHISLTRSMLKRTLPQQTAQRARLRRRLRTLYFHQQYIQGYLQQIEASDRISSATPEGEAAMPRDLLPEQVEKSLANEEYMRKGWFARVAPTLSTDEQTTLFRETTKKLTLKAHQHNPRGSKGSLQRRSILALLRDTDKSYRQLQLRGGASIHAENLKRARNPFTGVFHSTLEKEIQATERWRAAESSRYHEILKRLESDMMLDNRSRRTLEKQNKVTSLKLIDADDHLRRLRLEGTSASPIGLKTEMTSQQVDYKNACKSARRASKSVTIPYQVQHYILGDIHDRSKRAFFVFGRREIPELMHRKGWNDPEGLSIKEFEHFMDEDENWRDLYQVIKEKIESLRFIRNAYAHEFSELNMDRLEELLVDAKSIARLLGDRSLVSLIEQYEDRLAKYCKSYVEKCAFPKRKLWHELMAAKNDRDAALEHLVASKGTGPTHREDLDAEKLRVQRRFQESKAISKAAYRDFELSLASELKAFSLSSSIRYRLELGGASWAASLVQTLSKEYAAKKSVLETAQDANTTETQNLLTLVKVSNVSTPGPRISQASNAIPSLRPVMRTPGIRNLNQTPGLQQRSLAKDYIREPAPTKRQNVKRRGLGRKLSSERPAKVNAQSLPDKPVVRKRANDRWPSH